MTHTNAAELLDLAAARLLAAADTATRRAEDLFSPWHALAGQLALTAAGLSPTPSRLEDDNVRHGIPEHLAAAETALDQIAGLDGPPDLALWSWHVAELAKLADEMDPA